jgi:hypothetical protein
LATSFYLALVTTSFQNGTSHGLSWLTYNPTCIYVSDLRKTHAKFKIKIIDKVAQNFNNDFSCIILVISLSVICLAPCPVFVWGGPPWLLATGSWWGCVYWTPSFLVDLVYHIWYLFWSFGIIDSSTFKCQKLCARGPEVCCIFFHCLSCTRNDQKVLGPIYF